MEKIMKGIIVNKFDQEVSLVCGHIKSSKNGISNNKNNSKLCPACTDSIIGTEFAALSKLAAQQNEQAGLLKLEGSDRQVAWAEIIRAEIVPQLDGFVSAKQRYAGSPENAEYLSECASAWAEIAKKIKSVSTAEWFINRRNNLISKIVGGFHDYGEGEFVISTMDYQVLKMKRLQFLRNFKI
jgi:hypothetical protein